MNIKLNINEGLRGVYCALCNECQVVLVQACLILACKIIINYSAMTLILKAKEIECQKCRKFHVTAYETRWVKECYPVFDEHCSTKYDKERDIRMF